MQVAARNAGEFFVDKISNHKGSTSRKTEMEFLVSWKGYSSEADSWEPLRESVKHKLLLITALAIGWYLSFQNLLEVSKANR